MSITQENKDGDNVGRDKIINYNNQTPHTVPKFITKLPSLNDKVIGREEDLKNLTTAIRNSHQVVLMNGMGGVGKTTVAIDYLHQNKEDYSHICWVEQLSDFATDIATNQLLCKNLNFTPTNDLVNDTKFILNALANLKGKSLMIIDNGDDQLKAFSEYLPQAPNWHVLITSRQEMPFAKNMKLGFLSKENALALFYDHYKLDQNDELVSKILETVDYHTLTIEILAKTAQNLDINSIEKIASLLEERGIQIGKPVDLTSVSHVKNKGVEAQLFPYLKSIFQIANLNEDEKDLLKKFVALPPVFIYWENLLFLISSDEMEETTKDNLNIARNKLFKNGWLIYNEAQGAYKLHRIIQDVLFDQLQPTYKDIENILLNICNLFYIDDFKDNPVSTFKLIPFGERVIKILENIDHPANEDLANFKNNLALAYKDFGNFEKAKELLSLILQSEIQNLGEDHPANATTRSNLALVYQDLGNFEKAKELLSLALISDIQNFGEDHPDTNTCRSNLALVHKDLRDFEKAKELLSLTLLYDVQNFGVDHPANAISCSNLALVYRDLGDFEKAKDLLNWALEFTIQNLGEDHPDTNTCRSNLALVYQNLGNFEKAKGLSSLALKFTIRNFGEDHPNIAISCSNLAVVYLNLGDFEKAKTLFIQAYNTFNTFLGEDHPNTKTVKEWIDKLDK